MVVNPEGSPHELSVLCRDCCWPTWRDDSREIVLPKTVANYWAQCASQVMQMESMLSEHPGRFADHPDKVSEITSDLDRVARHLRKKAERLKEPLPSDAAAFVRRRLGD
jgi:hypothetical protein